MMIEKCNSEQESLTGNFRFSFFVTWLYVCVAIAVFLICVICAGFLPSRSFLYYLIQNIGIFLAFTVLLSGYNAIYKTLNYYASAQNWRENIKWSLKNFHYFLGASLFFLMLFIVIVLIEVGISTVSYIPFVGPAIITILTAPLFFINFLCLLIGICLVGIFPAIFVESGTLGAMWEKLKLIMRSKWINVLFYMIISISLLLISMQIIYYIIRYTSGITKIAQSHIQYAYPEMISRLGMSSVVTDIFNQLFPQQQTVSPAQYSVAFVKALKYIIGISYTVVFSIIISFPLSLYFSITARYVNKLLVDAQSEAQNIESAK